MLQIVDVSPLIRLARWTALSAGILYGIVRQRYLCEYHADIREWEHEQDIKATEEHLKGGGGH